MRKLLPETVDPAYRREELVLKLLAKKDCDDKDSEDYEEFHRS